MSDTTARAIPTASARREYTHRRSHPLRAGSLRRDDVVPLIPQNEDAEDAMQEILRNAGTQFDPEVVRAFSDVERRGLLSSRAPEPTRVADPRVPSEV